MQSAAVVWQLLPTFTAEHVKASTLPRVEMTVWAAEEAKRSLLDNLVRVKVPDRAPRRAYRTLSARVHPL